MTITANVTLQESEEEEFDENDQSIRKRRRMRKKRRDFFQTFSDPESVNNSNTSGDEVTSDSEAEVMSKYSNSPLILKYYRLTSQRAATSQIPRLYQNS